MKSITRYIFNMPLVCVLGLLAALVSTACGASLTESTLGFAVAGATLGQGGKVTLLDFAKSIDPDGKTAAVVELLSQTNEILTDMLWIEGNLPTGHRTTVRTGLPTPTWRKLYQGVSPTKSIRAQVDDTCGMLEDRSEIDKDVAELNGNTPQFRLSEAQAHLEGMNQGMATALIYEQQSVNPERITGLAPRYNTLSASVPTSQNVISAGGSGSDNTSVWLVAWGSNTIHGIFPKGSKAGIVHDDLGLIDAFDTDNKRFRAYADHWQWKCGLSVRDWRYAVRICNIDVSDLVAQSGTQANTAATWLHKLMLRAMARIPSMKMGRPVFYANRTVREMLSIGALDKSNAALAIQSAVNQFGVVTPGSANDGTLTFFGVPVRTVDQILNTEAVVA